MARMRRVEIAIALLRQHNAYLLQRREGAREIGAVGLVGCFGGKRKPTETGLQAVVRELGEETNLRLPPGRYMRIGTVEVMSDMKLKPVHIQAQVFTADVPAAFQVKALEGELVSMTLSEMQSETDLLTPATRAVVQQLMG